MLSYIKSFYHYFFPNESVDKDDDIKQQFLAEQLLDLELTEQEEPQYDISPTTPVHRSAACYERTGIITDINENYILIDGMIHFDITSCGLNLHVNDKVAYLCYKDINDTIVIVRILENHGTHWGDEQEAIEESSYKLLDHILMGEVDYREKRTVVLKDSGMKFDLDSVTASFVPVQGDWLELLCKVKCDENNPGPITWEQVVEVTSFKALRCKVKPAVITEWNGETGICDRLYYFHKHCIENPGEITVGSKAMIEAIESTQDTCTWRVIKMVITETKYSDINTTIVDNKEDKSLEIEKKQNIQVTYPLKFDNVLFEQNPSIILNITNNNDQPIVLNKWIILCKKRDSQVNISPFLNKPKKIYPRQNFSLNITCHPKFFGRTKEHLIVMFRGFNIERMIEVNVITGNESNSNDNDAYLDNNRKTEVERISMLKDIRKNKDAPLIRGLRPHKAPNFVAVKIGIYPIPDKVWNAVLGDSNETVYHVDYNKIITRIENHLPCLIQTLNIHNYADKFHTLIHMEEIQEATSMRCYDMSKAFLIRCQEYLGIEILGLAEKRPSLMVGDKVVVKDIWDDNTSSYEGFIHLIRGDLVLIKFHPHFHETYSGCNVSVQFHFNRTVFRRAHQAVNYAISNLGVDVLFPSHVKTRPPKIPKEKLEKIEWCNKYLNEGQKSVVKNILLGECRPMPYCIYGPPGTGKTVTVIETILQILAHNPDSRILVAAPSNSAANLITERLLMYKKYLSNSVVRLIANYLIDSENIPDVVKPYCATMDIAREDTIKSKHVVKDGMNLNVSLSYIVRYRVTIGTCYCLSCLVQVGLPKGHYTHVIVDEAGQALEPEIMIPLTFIDKEHGQIILAGDPMQLGATVMSRYCLEFGYDESYMSRILQTYPYQKDFYAYPTGFNEKLVTRLTVNYRSLEEVIKLPSEMFYDASLVAKLQTNMPWIRRLLDIVTEIFESPEDPKTGGIYVYGIKGSNTRAEDSPSWFNPQEASMVALTACKLFKKNVTVDDIGVITPYVAQIRYLRLLFNAMGLPLPKIGTVEEFQGQERPLILLSTVRTTESYVVMDQKFGLGFVKCPKRLNVALTRAQVAVLMFCDPHLLLTDPMWYKVINYAVKTDKYVGYDMSHLRDIKTNDLNIE